MAEVSHYRKFAEKMFQKDSKYIPEILKMMINDAQAELLMSLPGTVKDMAGKLNRSEDEIESDLKDMFRKGLTFKREKEGVVTWRGPGHIVQFHDAAILWPEAPQEFLDLWVKYMEDEFPAMARMVAKISPKPVFRVIAVNQSLDSVRNKVIAPDEVMEIINAAKRFAVTKCTCRMTMKKCDRPVENCIQLNRGADYAIERGSGREITKEECLELIKQAEEAGLVHATMNMTNLGKVHVICNCCGCCCEALPYIINEGLPMNAPSRFRAEVNADTCSACGDCEDRCWFNAIAVGDEVAEVNAEKCMGCGLCVTDCPEDAITMVEAREPGFIPG